MVKNLSASAGDTGSILGSGRSPGAGKGSLLLGEATCLENPTDRGAQQAIVRGVAKESNMT